VPYPLGGNKDIVARLYGQTRSERLGQPVVIDNRGGAAGTLGVGQATKPPNDGYTMVIGDLGSMVIAPLANAAVPYSYKDLAPAGLLATVSIVVSANSKSEMVKHLNAELLAIAASPALRDKLRDLGLNAQSDTLQEFGDLLRTETEKVARIVKDAGIKLE
jgi:tripartite-type tricarboxylate transporter receptor subunit TctC